MAKPATSPALVAVADGAAPRVLPSLPMLKPTAFGDNIMARMEGGKLILEIDVTPEVTDAAPPSSSGKLCLIANSSGWQKIPGTKFKLNLGLGRPNEGYVAPPKA